MNIIIPQFDPAAHFGTNCVFWNSHDDWFIERDQIKIHRYEGSLVITDIANAMKPGKSCEYFAFNFNWHVGQPQALYRIFERHGYDCRALFNELAALPWAPRTHWRTGAPATGWQSFELPQLATLGFDETGTPGESLQLHREEHKSTRVWSPFAKVNPLPAKPAKWTISHVVRALLAGQFENLRCKGVYTDDYAFDNAVNYQEGKIASAVAFARRIVESPSGWWAHEHDGVVSICCHSFDSNEFTPKF